LKVIVSANSVSHFVFGTMSKLTRAASPSHRQNSANTITLNEQQCGRLRSDPTLRLFLFSYAEQPLTAYTRLDIAFPSQIEVRVNNDEVKANYKGLKNKPGSTRPVDITSLVRTTPPNYRNQIHITYALTQKASAIQVSYPLFCVRHQGLD
jgi:E3 SUMO-protein ligase PIAS1